MKEERLREGSWKHSLHHSVSRLEQSWHLNQILTVQSYQKATEIEELMGGDYIELGQRGIDNGEELSNEGVNVSTRGRIPMPEQFESMRELLSAIEEALPRNIFIAG